MFLCSLECVLFASWLVPFKIRVLSLTSNLLLRRPYQLYNDPHAHQFRKCTQMDTSVRTHTVICCLKVYNCASFRLKKAFVKNVNVFEERQHEDIIPWTNLIQPASHRAWHPLSPFPISFLFLTSFHLPSSTTDFFLFLRFHPLDPTSSSPLTGGLQVVLVVNKHPCPSWFRLLSTGEWTALYYCQYRVLSISTLCFAFNSISISEFVSFSFLLSIE